jgi:hypothetical protein
MSKTTIPRGGITADAIDATLIADDAISEEHLDATAITGSTELAATPADTDELLISDAGTLKRIDASHVLSKFIRVANVESNSLSLTGFMSSSYYLYTIYASVTNTGTDNTFLNMRFLNSSDQVVTANLNGSFIYTMGDGSTDYDVLSQNTASSNTNRLSIGDDINETYNYVINITNHQGNNIFYNFTATTENWTNGTSHSIKGGGKFYSDGTNITGVDFLTNAGTSVSGKIAAFAIKTS